MMLYFAALTCLMVLVIYFDTTQYLIPNWINGLVGALYVPMLFSTSTPIEWKMALLGALIVFCLGYIIFLKKWMGGGDIKLLTVTALWVGLANLPEYILLVAIIGGVLSVAVLAIRKFIPLFVPKYEASLPKLLQKDAPLAYGIAIALGFIIMLWGGKVPGIMLAV